MGNLYFVGPMGCGKTTVGRLVAERLGRPFVDTDALVVQRAGRTIPEIFARDGEEGFRRLETAVLQELRDGMVVATGGGALLRPENRAHIRATGHVLWLRVSHGELFRRLSAGDGFRRRPLLRGPDPEGTLRAILAKREPIYQEMADLIINTEGLAPAQAAEAVIKALEARGYAGKGAR